MRLRLLALLFFCSCASAEKISLGVFSLATEADWGAAFELESGGRLEVTPWTRSEDGEDESAKPIAGHWKESVGGLELQFGKFKDQLRFESECVGWKDYHCFRYAKSLNKTKSPLNQTYAYVNWSWKNTAPHSVTRECRNQCAEMNRKGELKTGMTVEACAESMCR